MSAALKMEDDRFERVFVRHADRSSKAIAEFASVVLLIDAETYDGEPVPAGTVGAVVAVYDQGAAYDVEVTDPTGVISVAAASVRLAL